jgi:NADPH-dependent curcumin reductase CurA
MERSRCLYQENRQRIWVAYLKLEQTGNTNDGVKKCSFVRDDLGFDTAIDYRAPDFEQKFKMTM